MEATSDRNQMTQQEEDEACPEWQRLIDEAYARWQKDGDLHGLDYDSFVDSLPERHQAAVALKNLNYQVGNGGFSQWHYNEYSVDADALLGLLNDQIGTPASRQAGEVLSEVNEAIGFNERLVAQYSEAARDHRNNEMGEFQEAFADFALEHLHGELERLDSRYWELSGQLMKDIEAFLTRTKGETTDAPA